MIAKTLEKWYEVVLKIKLHRTCLFKKAVFSLWQIRSQQSVHTTYKYGSLLPWVKNSPKIKVTGPDLAH